MQEQKTNNIDEQKKIAREKRHKRTKKICLCLFVVFAVSLVGIFLGVLAGNSLSGSLASLFDKHTENEKEKLKPRTEFAVINLPKVFQAHYRYNLYKEKQDERKKLSWEIAWQDHMHLLSRLQQQAMPDEKIFDDAARQKRAQVMLQHHDEITRELEEKEKALRERLRPSYEKERDEINAEYFHEIFNLQLNLDNAKTMRLTQKEQEEMQLRLKEKQRERGRKQLELYNRYEDEIKRQHAAATEQVRRMMRAEGNALGSKMQAQEREKLQSVKERNEKFHEEKKLQEIKFRDDMREKIARLKLLDAEINQLEEKILTDVKSRATKLAKMGHYEMIFVSPSAKISVKPKEFLKVKDVSQEDSMQKIFAIQMDDLTEDMIKEMHLVKE